MLSTDSIIKLFTKYTFLNWSGWDPSLSISVLSTFNSIPERRENLLYSAKISFRQSGLSVVIAKTSSAKVPVLFETLIFLFSSSIAAIFLLLSIFLNSGSMQRMNRQQLKLQPCLTERRILIMTVRYPLTRISAFRSLYSIWTNLTKSSLNPYAVNVLYMYLWFTESKAFLASSDTRMASCSILSQWLLYISSNLRLSATCLPGI